MRTLVYAVIAYFARDNTVHAHTRTRVKLSQSHTRSFAQTQMHGCRRTHTHTHTDADRRGQTDADRRTRTDADRRTDAQTQTDARNCPRTGIIILLSSANTLNLEESKICRLGMG